MRSKTVVKVDLPVVDENGNPELNDKNDQVTEEVMFYLLHWGLHMEVLEDKKTGQYFPTNYTVGICQHIKTGQIKIFMPELITVVGYEQK